jgi:hypothetical protein
MSFKSLSIVAAAALTLCAGAAQADNGFANGGFETAFAGPVAPQGPAANWLIGASGYGLDTLAANAHTGSNSLLLASPQTNSAIAVQNSVKDGGLGPLTVGDTPVLSFWAKGTAGATGNALFSLQYLDGVGNILYNSGNQFFQGAINTSAYSLITFAGGVVPVGAVAAYLQLAQNIGPIGTGPAGENWFAGRINIDDVNLQVAAAVPEPESYAMMLAGLGVIGSIVRRRRRAV